MGLEDSIERLKKESRWFREEEIEDVIPHTPENPTVIEHHPKKLRHKRNKKLKPLSTNNVKIVSISNVKKGIEPYDARNIYCKYHEDFDVKEGCDYVIFVLETGLRKTVDRDYRPSVIKDYGFVKPFIREIIEDIGKRKLSPIEELAFENLKKIESGEIDYKTNVKKHDLEFHQDKEKPKRTRSQKKIIPVNITESEYKQKKLELKMNLLSTQYDLDSFILRYQLERTQRENLKNKELDEEMETEGNQQ